MTEAGRLPGTERVVLRDGTTVHIRPIGPDDAGALTSAFQRLSPDSRYRRFLAPVKQLDRRMLDYLTRIDHLAHEALVAVDPDNGELVGVSRYVAEDETRQSAEVAMVVADGWEGRGLATILLVELADRAREAGVQRFTALVLDQNRDALDVLSSLGPTTMSAEEYGMRGLSIELSADGAEAALQRALGHAGRGELAFLPSAAQRT